MGRYDGGRGLKWPKIGDVVYGWPLRERKIHITIIKKNIQIRKYFQSELVNWEMAEQEQVDKNKFIRPRE